MNLTHLDENNKPKMVDVSGKDETTRIAVASGIIEVTQDAYNAVVSNSAKKDQCYRQQLLQPFKVQSRLVHLFLCVTL